MCSDHRMIERDGEWFYRLDDGSESPIRAIHARLCIEKGIKPKPSWLAITDMQLANERKTARVRVRQKCQLPAPDADAVERERQRAEERGLSWLVHGSVGMLAWWMRIGRVEQEKAERRLRVCQTSGDDGGPCRYYGDGIKCGKCGCNFRAKLTAKNAVCPIGHW